MLIENVVDRLSQVKLCGMLMRCKELSLKEVETLMGPGHSEG